MHSTKLEIIKEIDNFLNRSHFSKLNEIKKTHLNRHNPLGKQNCLQVCNEYESKAMSFRVESYQTFKEDLTSILLSVFKNIETKILANLFSEHMIYLVSRYS